MARALSGETLDAALDGRFLGLMAAPGCTISKVYALGAADRERLARRLPPEGEPCDDRRFLYWTEETLPGVHGRVLGEPMPLGEQYGILIEPHPYHTP